MKKEHVQYIIIHHYGFAKATLQSIRNRHMEEMGWTDIGYHYIIGNGNGIPDGEVVEGRSTSKGSCQCRDFNSRSISVLLVGDFDRYYPSKTQWKSLLSLLRRLMDEFNVPVDCVIGHREAYRLAGREAERSCPGWKMDMDKLRKELYPEGTELFTDGTRRRFDISLSYEGTTVIDVEPYIQDNRIMIDVQDLEKIFDVTVELQPKMKRVEITKVRAET